MAALTTIALGLLITSAVLAAASVATTIIGAKTGNKTLSKIGKITGYVAMGTGIASAGVGIAASMGAAAATTTAEAAAGQVAEKGATTAASEVGSEVAMKGATTAGQNAAVATTENTAGTVTGQVTQAAAEGAPTTVVAPTTTGTSAVTGAPEAVAPTATGPTSTAPIAGKTAAPSISEQVAGAGAQVTTDQAGRLTQNIQPKPMDVMAPSEFNNGSSIVSRATVPQPAPVEESLIPQWAKQWYNDIKTNVGAGLSEVKDFTKENPLAAYGIVATIGSGMSGLFEADVADKKLKQEQRQFQAIQDRQNQATYI